MLSKCHPKVLHQFTINASGSLTISSKEKNRSLSTRRCIILTDDQQHKYQDLITPE